MLNVKNDHVHMSYASVIKKNTFCPRITDFRIAIQMWELSDNNDLEKFELKITHVHITCTPEVQFSSVLLDDDPLSSYGFLEKCIK